MLGGKYAEAFYINIEVQIPAEEAKLDIMESKVELKGINAENVALFLACFL